MQSDNDTPTIKKPPKHELEYERRFIHLLLSGKFSVEKAEAEFQSGMFDPYHRPLLDSIYEEYRDNKQVLTRNRYRQKLIEKDLRGDVLQSLTVWDKCFIGTSAEAEDIGEIKQCIYESAAARTAFYAFGQFKKAAQKKGFQVALQEHISLLSSRINATSGNAIEVKPMSVYKLKAVPWLWQGRIPFGKITLISGDPGLGKSLFTLYVASCVSTGTSFVGSNGHQTPQGKVVLLGNEDGPEDTIAPRLKLLGADLNAVLHITNETSFSFAEDLGRLRNLITKQPEIKLLIVDPLSAYLGGKTDSYKDSDVRRVLSPLSALADETGVAIIGIMHHKKGRGGSAIEKITGSGAFPAVARSALTFAKDPDNPDRRLVGMTKSNNAKPQKTLAYKIQEDTSIKDDEGNIMALPRLVWDGFSDLSADEIMNSEITGGSKNDAVAWLRKFLSQGEFPSAEVAKAAEKEGIAWRTLQRAKKEICFKAYKKGDVWWWPQLAATTNNQKGEKQGKDTEL